MITPILCLFFIAISYSVYSVVETSFHTTSSFLIWLKFSLAKGFFLFVWVCSSSMLKKTKMYLCFVLSFSIWQATLNFYNFTWNIWFCSINLCHSNKDWKYFCFFSFVSSVLSFLCLNIFTIEEKKFPYVHLLWSSSDLY